VRKRETRVGPKGVASSVPEARIDAELVAELERLSLYIHQRLRRRGEEARGDRVAEDEVFVIAGQLEGVLAAAIEQVRALRDEVDRAAREGD
jgi:hypothetical protein